MGVSSFLTVWVGRYDRLHSSDFKVQLCLSVKTQPHEMVLKEAHEAGYLGEVITKVLVTAVYKS